MLAVSETAIGAAAALSSIVGVVLAILSHLAGRKSAKRKAEKETHDQLLAAQREAEQLSAELHKLRMEMTHDEAPDAG